jgi:RHS repeat-associated protein
VQLGDPVNEEPVKRNYNGVVSSLRWKTEKPFEVEGEALSGIYAYTYDDKYQIRDATWAPYSSLLLYQPSTNQLRLTGMQYDPNGNIKALKRYDPIGNRIHDFTYNYAPNNNQVTNVSGYVSNFVYNKIGQMTEQHKTDGSNQFVEYDVAGRVSKVYSRKNGTTFEGLETEFLYDERGFRQAKLNYKDNRTTWYIRDASGTIISTYEQEGTPSFAADGTPIMNTNPVDQTEIPIYGSGRVGQYYPGQDGSVNYELTDHLGNVRALVRDNSAVYTATMEDNGQADIRNPRVSEIAFFENITETADDNIYMNHTAPMPGVEETPDKAAYLYWVDGMLGMEASDKSMGPAIALQVNPGDKIDLKTWARFERKETYVDDVPLALLAGLLGNTFVGVGGFESYISTQVSNNMYSQLLNHGIFNNGADPARPSAYLNYLVYDSDLGLLAADRRQIADEAGFYPEEMGLLNSENAQVLKFDAPIEITQKGYIYIWVSNESENTKVWFDDLTVTHHSSFVTQATDYGVWGDVLREQKVDESQYRFGYQGQFGERDLETGWNHFELREYDPIVGRWTIVDPKRVGFSPYIGMYNNPVSGIDPDGGGPNDWYYNKAEGLRHFEGSGEREGYTHVAGDEVTFAELRKKMIEIDVYYINDGWDAFMKSILDFSFLNDNLNNGSDFADMGIGLTQYGIDEYIGAAKVGSRFSKSLSLYKGLGTLGKFSSGIGFVTTFTSVGFDLYAWKYVPETDPGHISGYRFAWRTVGNFSSIFAGAAAGTAFGGPLGAAVGGGVGGGFWAAEQSYDAVIWYGGEVSKGAVNFQNNGAAWFFK